LLPDADEVAAWPDFFAAAAVDVRARGARGVDSLTAAFDAAVFVAAAFGAAVFAVVLGAAGLFGALAAAAFGALFAALLGAAALAARVVCGAAVVTLVAVPTLRGVGAGASPVADLVAVLLAVFAAAFDGRGALTAASTTVPGLSEADRTRDQARSPLSARLP
jgi:hypothetical protein